MDYSDPLGTSAAACEPWKFMWVLPAIDGPVPIGDILFVVAVCIFGSSNPDKSPWDAIDWNSGDKNHILKGTFNKHVSGWKRLGIDPNDGNAWEYLLPILHEVVDKADRITPELLPSGGKIIWYSKTYAEFGVQVAVKIWTDALGIFQKLSDAIPYIINN